MLKFYLHLKYSVFLFIFFVSGETALAQETAQNALNHTSLSTPWNGSIDWITGSLPKDISVRSIGVNGGLLKLKIMVGQNKCVIEVQEQRRAFNGAVTMMPLNDTCNVGLTVLNIVPTRQSEIGMVLMSDFNLLGQAQFKPSRQEQKLEGETLRPRMALPRSLAGYFYVTPSGAVYEFLETGEGIQYKIKLLDQWMEDAGLKIGEISAKGKYRPPLGEVTSSEKIKILPGLREAYKHCGPIYARRILYNVVAFEDEQLKEANSILYAVQPKEKKYCGKPRTSRTSCRVTDCEEYTSHIDQNGIILNDANFALKLGAAGRITYKTDKSYAEALGELKAKNYGTRTKKGSPGYFERDGACGNLSCEEEGTLQFIVDEYW